MGSERNIAVVARLKELTASQATFESKIGEMLVVFNTEVMPRMRDVGYRGIRKAMNERGFPGHVWHVGHACPDPSKKSTLNDEDFGWNLFAQHAVDNANLGHCLVSCAEAEHVGASHVRCTRSEGCVQTCSDSWW